MGNNSKNRKKNSRRKKTKRANTKNDIRSIEISGGNPAIIPALFSLADIGLIIFESVKDNESLSSPERSPSSRGSQSDTTSTPSERRLSTTGMLTKPSRGQSRTASNPTTAEISQESKTGTSELERSYGDSIRRYEGQTKSKAKAKGDSSFFGRKKKQFTKSLTTMDTPTFNTIFNFEITGNLSEKRFYTQSYNKNNISDIGVFDKLFTDIKSVFYEEYQKLESSFFDIKYKLPDLEQDSEQEFKILNRGDDELRGFIINATKTQEVNITVNLKSNLKSDTDYKDLIFINNNEEQEKIKIFKEDKNTTIKDLLLVTRIYNLLKKHSEGYYLIYFNSHGNISYLKKEDFNKNISEHFTYLFERGSETQIDEIFIVPTSRQSRKFYLDFSEYFKLPNNPFKGKSFEGIGIKSGFLEITSDITNFNIKDILPTPNLSLPINLKPSTPKPKQNSSPGFLSRFGRKKIGPADNVSGSEKTQRVLPKKTPKKDKSEPKKMPKPGTGIRLESAPRNVSIE